ncbi:MAG TPA: GlsB/YeaQ/YmgE family stress response membrane protein [Patescibacteria group bacterium]|nr:GlsB/YeaQ/YmgE family stress response membrane protein [Patescibacteria group bacterium]
MSIFGWIILGLIAGTVANAIDPHPSSGGIVGAIVLGIVGAMVGGFLANILLGVDVSGFNLTSFVVAIAGSLLLLFVGRAMRSA